MSDKDYSSIIYWLYLQDHPRRSLALQARAKGAPRTLRLRQRQGFAVENDAEKESIEGMFHGVLDAKIVLKVNAILGKETEEIGGNLTRTQKILFLLRFCVEQLYKTNNKYQLQGFLDTEKTSEEYQQAICALYEEEYRKLDKTDTLAYLVFCMKNKDVYAEVEKLPGKNASFESFMQNYMKEKNTKALSDWNKFKQLPVGYDDEGQQTLPWVYGSGATGDDLPPHLEWAYISKNGFSEKNSFLSPNVMDRSPLRFFKDPSEHFARVCKPFDPKMLVAGQERLLPDTEDNALMTQYTKYLHAGWQEFLTAAKGIPEKNREAVLLMAQKTQLKEAQELKKEFDALVPYLEQGRAFHTYQQYRQMKDLTDLVHSKFHHVRRFFPKQMEVMTAEKFAKALEEAKDGQSTIFSSLNKLLDGIGKVINFTFTTLKNIISWTAGKFQNAWNYLASSKAGQWAIAAVGDPVRAARQVRYIAALLQHFSSGFGQFLGRPQETIVAEGSKEAMEELKLEKEKAATDDVSELRQNAYDYLLQSLQARKKEELSEEIDAQKIGFEDEKHYKTLELKVKKDFPVRRIYILKEDEQTPGYYQLRERWSWLGVLGSWAQTATNGAIEFDWSLYEKDLDQREWWGGFLSWMRVFGFAIRRGVEAFFRTAKRDMLKQGLEGIQGYFTDEKNLKFATGALEGLVDTGAAALAPYTMGVSLLGAGATKWLLRSTVKRVADTVVAETKYALVVNDYYALLDELQALFDMELLVESLFAGSVKGFVSFNCLTFTNLLLQWQSRKPKVKESGEEEITEE